MSVLCDVGKVFCNHLCVWLYVGGIFLRVFAQNPTRPPRKDLVFKGVNDKIPDFLLVVLQIGGHQSNVEAFYCEQGCYVVLCFHFFLSDDARIVLTFYFYLLPLTFYLFYPTLPSRLICRSFCASTANSIGRRLITSLA